MSRRSIVRLVPLVLVFAACTAPTARPTGQTTSQARAASVPSPGPDRTLVMVARGEPPSLAARPLTSFSGSLTPPVRIFNATLDYLDESEGVHPYLAQELPKLNTDTWKVNSDGTMETTYYLKPNLTWQDGTPLSAEDFVFAWHVYATPELGAAGSPPISEMSEVIARDPSTIAIRWKRPYPDAAQMDQDFQALPSHILASQFESLDANGFVNLPFWTSEYVGLGAYRVESWEPGAYIDAVAFPGYVLGPPKIGRIHLTFIPDANTAMSNILSGDANFIGDYVLSYEEGATLENTWKGTGGGTVRGHRLSCEPSIPSAGPNIPARRRCRTPACARPLPARSTSRAPWTR